MARDIAERLSDRKVRHDIALMGDFISIWCDANHASLARQAVTTEGAQHHVYGRRPAVLCSDCEKHLAYAERRRAFCSKDPKPFCAHCDSQCYASVESEWQREMMRFAGPRSWTRGHLVDGIKHMFSSITNRRRLRAAAAARGAAGKKGTLG